MSSGFRDVFLAWGFIYAKFILFQSFKWSYSNSLLLLWEENFIHYIL